MGSIDILIRNARVFTVNASQPWAEAVGVEGDKIAFVGSDEEAAALAGPKTKVLDAGGRLVLPGFIDAHVHCLSAHQIYFWADLTPASSQEELLKAIERHASAHPEHRLVGGFGYRYMAVMAGGKLPGRSVLDKVVSDRPVWLMSYDGWTACTNSRFVEIAQNRLGDAFDRMPGVERDPQTGQPTGVFYKTDELEPILDDLSASGTDVVYEGLKLVIDDMVRWGVTSFHDVGAMNMQHLETYARLRRNGELKARVYLAMQYARKQSDEQVKEFDQARSQYSDEWIRVGAVKLFIDGVEDSHTAAMLEPYADQPDVKGDTIYPPEEFDRIIENLDRMGFQCVTHSCGDRGVRVVLDAYEKAALRNGPRERRHRIEHVEMVSPDDIPRFKALGVIPSMQPLHAHLSTTPFDEAYGRALGPERLQRSFPWRSMVESGARLSFSSDWPVADMNPFLGIHTALTRGGLPGPHNTIGLEDAIKGYTINAAYALFEEDLKGSIEVGKLADMIVLSDDLFRISKDAVKNVEPLLTIVGGRVVYRSGRLDA
ncbi:MAG: amidohydrolase [Candidatus Thermoplasmatota archaeon]|nr:amidohydrolase [Candidatus Thermoplasmatota archaeon]